MFLMEFYIFAYEVFCIFDIIKSLGPVSENKNLH